jgi:predicted permease
MRRFAHLRRFFRDARRGRRIAAEVDEELRFHYEELVQELREGGVGEDEARRQAQARFGRFESVRDEAARAKGVGLVEDLVQDLRYGLRCFRRQPGFTAAAVLTLALGIGANTAVFTLVNAVLLEPLPYAEPDRLTFIHLRNPSLGIERGALGEADFLAVARRQRAFEAVAAAAPSSEGFTWVGGGTPEQVPGMAVTSTFFSVLGVRPILGRVFLPAEDRPGRAPTVVVSAVFYRDRLASNPAALGRAITLSGRSYTVVGVMPPGFRFATRYRDEVWPILQLEEPRQRQPYYLTVVGRLRPGETEAHAAADVTRIAGEVRKQFPRSDPQDGAVTSMKELLVGEARRGLLVLLGAVTLVLLIALVNVSSLQLARGASRRQEMAIRTALGARSLRLLRQLGAEALVLASTGGALGVLLAWAAVRAVVAAEPDFVPRLGDVAINMRVLAFTSAIVLLSAVVCGMLPALRARSQLLGGALNGRDPFPARGLGRHRSHAELVVVQVALALVLLVGAGLLVRSLLRLQGVDPGCNPRQVLTMRLSLPEARYPGAAQTASAYQQVLERVAAQPGVLGAAISLSLPPNLLRLTNPFHLEGQSYEPSRATQLAEEIPIGGDYFRSLGIPLIAGRVFDERDRASGLPVLIVNEAMARRFFGGTRAAVGRRIQTGDANPESPWETIVGVVGNVKYQGLAEADEPTIYVPYHADGWNPWFVRSMFLVARTSGEPESLVSPIRRAVWSLDRDIPVSQVRTLEALFDRAVSRPRFGTTVLTAFALLALILAALGLYGTLAYSVAQRTHDIGVRMAIGASGRAVVGEVLRQGMGLALAGIAVGAIGALMLTGLMTALLFGVEPTDPATFGVSALTLALVAACAAYVPARRAARVDPIRALKCE